MPPSSFLTSPLKFNTLFLNSTLFSLFYYFSPLHRSININLKRNLCLFTSEDAFFFATFHIIWDYKCHSKNNVSLSSPFFDHITHTHLNLPDFPSLADRELKLCCVFSSVSLLRFTSIFSMCHHTIYSATKLPHPFP